MCLRSLAARGREDVIWRRAVSCAACFCAVYQVEDEQKQMGSISSAVWCTCIDYISTWIHFALTETTINVSPIRRNYLSSMTRLYNAYPCGMRAALWTRTVSCSYSRTGPPRSSERPRTNEGMKKGVASRQTDPHPRRPFK